MNDDTSESTEFVSTCHGPSSCRICGSTSYDLHRGVPRCDGCARIVLLDKDAHLEKLGGRVVLEDEAGERVRLLNEEFDRQLTEDMDDALVPTSGEAQIDVEGWATPLLKPGEPLTLKLLHDIFDPPPPPTPTPEPDLDAAAVLASVEAFLRESRHKEHP